MLAELAAANAAFAVIKATLKNGKELVDAGSALIDYFKVKDTLQKTVNTQKASSSTRLFGNKGAMLEEFLVQEQALASLKRQEEELRELMIYHGRAGLWDDWLQFQAEYKRKQREEQAAIQREIQRKRQERQEAFELVFAILMSVGVVGFVSYIVFQFLSR